MNIHIPSELESSLQEKARSAGFRSVEEYVVHLVTAEVPRAVSRGEALRQLRDLRREVPRMTSQEIVDDITQGRDRCP